MKKPWVLNKINPNFFYDYSKMYGERAPNDHENYVERLLNAEDQRLKQYTDDKQVVNELEYELKKFMAYQRMRKVKDKVSDPFASSSSQAPAKENPPKT